mgnify:CR=1 FL=1
MKKNIFYLFAHQDDEFGIFIDILKKIKNNNIYVFYLTSGYKDKIHKLKLSKRDLESISVLKKIGVKKKNIKFIGKELDIRSNKLYSDIDKAYKAILKFTKKKIPHQIITLSWEGGHEDHDACNLLGRKIAFKFGIVKNSGEFSLYNAYKLRLIFFRVFNPINKKGNIIKINFYDRLFIIKLLFYYKSQFKIWIGLYPFVIFHYIFLGYNFIQPLNNCKSIEKPHTGKLLYESRKFCEFKDFKKKLIYFLND